MAIYKYLPEHAVWVSQNLRHYPSAASNPNARISHHLWSAFLREFPDFQPSWSSFRQFVQRTVPLGLVSGVSTVPDSPMSDISQMVLTVESRATLVTSDYQIPYHDAGLVRLAFDLGEAWGVEHHIINADLYDFASLSKFDASLHDYRRSAGEELVMGHAVVAESERRHGAVTVNTGNHEWRLMRRAMQSQLTDEQLRGLLAPGDGVRWTPLSYVILNGCIRVTHPGSASIVPGAVARALADRFQMNTIVAHGHGLGYARNYSGLHWALESGGMFDPVRQDYVMTADKRRPSVNQGFVILEGNQPFLIDPANADWNLWFALATASKLARSNTPPKEG